MGSNLLNKLIQFFSVHKNPLIHSLTIAVQKTLVYNSLFFYNILLFFKKNCI